MQQYFKINQLLQDAQNGGLIHTQFDRIKHVQNMNLSHSAEKIMNVPNAGGNSVISEVLSYEMMQRCFGARLLKTEMEVDYIFDGGSITDYLCEMFGVMLGVSVTRAMKFQGEFTEEDAERLLNKKLKGVIQSTRNAIDHWQKQLLHVWATSHRVANIVSKVYSSVPENLKANTVVMVTIAHDTSEIFTNK